MTFANFSNQLDPMTRKKTNQEFVDECRSLHNNFYDYSITQYTVWNGKIKYICPDHGVQEQRANDHRHGKGCNKCGREKTRQAFKYDTKTFIDTCNKIHNFKYDYRNTQYTDYKTVVRIGCKSHGEFSQVAGNHLSGNGCPKCGRDSRKKRSNDLTKRISQATFKQLASEVHGDRYDYSLVSYKQRHLGVTIVCKHHGAFPCIPDKHLKGVGCPVCKNFDSFVASASEIYPGKFEYNRSTFKNGKTKTRITCKIHGDFWQMPGDHLRDRNVFHCSACYLTSKRITREEFIQRSLALNGSAYGYDSVVMGETLDDFVILFCSKCQKNFSQRAINHLQGRGCAACCESQNEKKIRTWLESTDYIFEQQKGFPGLKHVLPLKCDFYLPEFNLVIEFDGVQHFEPVKAFGGEERFAIVQRRDQIKNEYCRASGINLLRIKDKQDVLEETRNAIHAITVSKEPAVFQFLYGKTEKMAL